MVTILTYIRAKEARLQEFRDALYKSIHDLMSYWN
jgi:hypothetical protein